MESNQTENFTESTTASTPGSNATYACSIEDYIYMNIAVYPQAVVVFIILVAVAQRSRTSCCGKSSSFVKRLSASKWAGCIYPVNMLDGYEDRFGYSCIFGSMALELIDIILLSTNTLSGFVGLEKEHYSTVMPLFKSCAKVMVILTNICLMSAAYYPLFICISTEYKMLGAILGLILALYRLATNLWAASTCIWIEDEVYLITKYHVAMYSLPAILCIFCLSLKFVFVIITCIKNNRYIVRHEDQKIAREHHLIHVQLLFRKERPPWHEEDISMYPFYNPKQLKSTFGFKQLPNFRYPTRAVSTFVVMASGLYQIGMMVIVAGFYILNLLPIFLNDLQSIAFVFGPEVSAAMSKYLVNKLGWTRMINNVWISTTCITGALSIFYVYHACIVYRKTIFRVYQGDKSLFPKDWCRQPSHAILTNAMRYAGMQIAYFSWGFMVVQVCVALFLFILVFVIFVPVVEYQYYTIVEFLAQLVILPLILNILIQFLQQLLVQHGFMQPKLEKTDSEKPLSVSKRNLFHNISYFFFFWNVTLGLVSAILRALKSLLLGIFFIPRTDYTTMMNGFESVDKGYLCYLSFVSSISAHDHPVLRVFLHLIIDGVSSEYGTGNMVTIKQGSLVKSKKARQNWLIAYTLINNPGLIKTRKGAILSFAEEKERARMAATSEKAKEDEHNTKKVQVIE